VSLVRDAHDASIRFATREWAENVSWLMLDDELCAIVASLSAGVTLAEAYPEEFRSPAPVAAAAPSSVPPVFVAPPSSPAPAVSAPSQPLLLGTPSLSRGLSPVLVPPARSASRSPASVSPVLTTPSPVVPSAPSRSPSAGSGVGAALPSPVSALPALLSSAPLPSVGGARPLRAGPSVLAPGTSKVPRVRPSISLLAFVYSPCLSSVNAVRRGRRGASRRSRLTLAVLAAVVQRPMCRACVTVSLLVSRCFLLFEPRLRFSALSSCA
jgi:hypothetical protein